MQLLSMLTEAEPAYCSGASEASSTNI